MNDEVIRRYIKEAVAKVLSDPSLSKSAMTAAGLTMDSPWVRNNQYEQGGAAGLASRRIRQSHGPAAGSSDPLRELSERSRVLGINKWAT